MAKVLRKIGVISCEDLQKWGGQEGSAKLFVQFMKIKGLGEGPSEQWPSLPEVEYVPIKAITGELPSETELKDYSGFLMSGSHYSVNDDLPWIKRLEEWVKSVKKFQENNVDPPRIVGLCFSHQLISKAFGGVIGATPSKEFVWKAEDIEVKKEADKHSFFNHPVYDGGQSFKLFQSHGEAVLSLPEEGKNLGSSPTCEHEIISINDHIVTMQSHPEIPAKMMIEKILPSLKAKGLITDEKAEESMKTFETGVTDDLVMNMIKNFLFRN